MHGGYTIVPSHSLLECAPHYAFAILLLASIAKAQFFIERTGATLTRYATGQDRPRAWTPTNMLEHQFERAFTEATSLEARIDHEAPEVVFLLNRILGQHYKAHRDVVGIHSPKPCHLRCEVGLGN